MSCGRLSKGGKKVVPVKAGVYLSIAQVAVPSFKVFTKGLCMAKFGSAMARCWVRFRHATTAVVRIMTPIAAERLVLHQIPRC
jgi:hypothetical protein